MEQKKNRATILAVDIGAGSGRLVGITFDQGRLEFKEYWRFNNEAQDDGTVLRWDIQELEAQVRQGLDLVPPEDYPCSLGFDTWGVDFVLLDHQDKLVEQARSYRNEYTREVMAEVAELVDKPKLYSITGAQTQHFNTIFQLHYLNTRYPDILAKAAHFLMIPDYFHWKLTGVQSNEYSNASTTALLDAQTRDWSDSLIASLGLPRHLFSAPVMPGTVLARQVQLGRHLLAVTCPASHDTGSGVAGVPLTDANSVYICTGTWCLIGVENPEPILTEEAQRLNFTNEGGVDGVIRFLKNCMGLWLLRRLQESLPGKPGFAHMVESAAQSEPFQGMIDCDDARFFNPADMVEAIDSYLKETGQPKPATMGAYVRLCIDSLALAFARVISQIQTFRKDPLSTVHLVGGGVQNALLCQLTANASGLVVHAGPIEATALGNALVQARSMGIIASLEEGRSLVRSSFPLKTYVPEPESRGAWLKALERYASLGEELSCKGG